MSPTRLKLPPLAWTIPGLAILCEASAFLHGLSPKIADPDSFYHLRHALIYRQQGIFNSAFPWLTQSMVSRTGGDLWYGFHLLILPLTYGSLLAGIYQGGVLATILSLVLFYFAVRRLQVRWPVLWTLFFLFCSGSTLYRLTMFRPHPLSLALTIVVFAAYFGDRASPRQWVTGFVGGFLIAWMHLSLFWAPLAAVAVAAAVGVVEKVEIRWRFIFLLAAGILVGALLRPQAMGALRLLYIQLFELARAKSHGVPLFFGSELDPFPARDFVPRFIPLTLFLVASGVILCGSLFGRPGLGPAWAIPRGPRRAALTASFVLAVGFGVMAFVSARRAMDQCGAFASVAVALAFTHLWEAWRRRRAAARSSGRAPAAAAAGLIVLAWMLFRSVHYFNVSMDTSCVPYKFEEAAAWMKTNIPGKTIVFVPYWDEFPQLFFWDDQHYYINGMDPVFQYVYSHKYYWNTYFIMTDQAARFTYDTENGDSSGGATETYKFMREESGAQYVLLRVYRSPDFNAYLASDHRFQKVFGNASVVIYKIL